MKAKWFILTIGILTLISLAVLLFILANTDPYNADILQFFIFYLSFFITSAGLFILAGFYTRRLFNKNKIARRLFGTASRQGILIAMILTGFLLLQSFRILAWWSGGIIVLLAIIFEIYLRKK